MEIITIVVWVKENYDFVLSFVVSLFYILVDFFLKDLWVSSGGKVYYLSVGKLVEYDSVIWFFILEDWWVMFLEGYDNLLGRGVSDGF